MSEATNSSTDANQSGDGGSTRKMILFGVLGLLLVGLAYDYKVARPAVDEAYDKLLKLTETTNRSLDEKLTADKVAEAIGQAPTNSFDDGMDMVEVYAWRSGLPIRTHKLYAVYRPLGEEMVLYRHAKYKYDKKSDVMAITTPTQVQIDPNDDSMDTDGGMSSGAAPGGPATAPGAGGGRPAGQPGGPGGRGRPEADADDSDTPAESEGAADADTPAGDSDSAEADTDGEPTEQAEPVAGE